MNQATAAKRATGGAGVQERPAGLTALLQKVRLRVALLFLQRRIGIHEMLMRDQRAVHLRPLRL